MGFKDAVMKSLGFDGEENDISSNNNSVVEDIANTISDSFNNTFANKETVLDQTYTQTNDDDSFYTEDFTIEPEHAIYELILIRPKTLDDINYIVDQILVKNNLIIMDLSFLEYESPNNFRLAGEKIKDMRINNGVESYLISQCEGRNLILIAPSNVKLIKKD